MVTEYNWGKGQWLVSSFATLVMPIPVLIPLFVSPHLYILQADFRLKFVLHTSFVALLCPFPHSCAQK